MFLIFFVLQIVRFKLLVNRKFKLRIKQWRRVVFLLGVLQIDNVKLKNPLVWNIYIKIIKIIWRNSNFFRKKVEHICLSNI